MGNGRRNGEKKTRNPSDAVRKESSAVRLGSHEIYEEAPVVTSLPPAVDGHLRCFLRVSVPTIHWRISIYPGNVLVQLKWWGEDGTGVLFRPSDNKKHKANSKVTSVRYPVCSGPKQFSAYLKDMGPLIFDVVHGESLMSLGQAAINDVTQLSASSPIHGLFDVISITSPPTKLADLNISLKFESTTAAFSQLSSSIPTVDLDIDNQRRAMEESDVEPSPPVSLNPATPINHPRKMSKDEDPFVSPAPLSSKGVKFALDSPGRFEYSGDHSLLRSPATIMQPSKNNATGRKASDKPVLTQTDTEDNAFIRNAASDLIGSLLKRGESLREAMVLSADENSNSMEETSAQHDIWNMPSETERSPAAGKLFTEILASQHSYKLFSSKDKDTATDSDVLHDNETVNLILGEEKYHYFGESLHSSDEETAVSESGDPLYDESILRDLFYTTSAEPDSEDTISSDDEQNVTHMHTMEETKHKGLPECDHDAFVKSTVKSSRKSSVVASATDTKETISVDNHEPGQQVVLLSPGNSPTASIQLETTSSNQTDLSENLGTEKLTALGRADTARVIVESIMVDFDHWRAENTSPGTFFIEYHFPTSTFSCRSQEFGCSMATEVTRVASKKIQQGVVLFNHRSVFPVFFNAAVTDHWWRLGLKFKVYYREMGQRMPKFLGVAALPLKTVLQSDTLSSSASLQIKSNPVSDDSLSRLSPNHAATNCGVGPLLVKVEVMTDGKPLHVKPSSHKKPPLPSTRTTTTKRVDHAEVKVSQIIPQTTSGVKLTKQAPQEKTPDHIATESNMENLPLYTLLWIPEGKHVTQQGYYGKASALPGIVSKNNLYLVCRMFWSEEVSKSRVCWGDVNPPFGFKQVSPVMLSPSLLQRACNNFMVVEVWNRLASSGDMLTGLVKLPLHQLYLSYRDPKITRTILKSKYPVVAVDEWSVITNPFTRTQHGYVRVLLTMGSMEQTSAILSLKCGGECPVRLQTDHHLDTVESFRDDVKRNTEQSLKNEDYVKHQFGIEVDNIRGLSIFDSTVWGETDCFVQYHFPTQGHNLDESEVPSLQAHRTPTTLCVPDPIFHDVAWHTFVLPQGFPVQKYLQAAFSGSWVTSPLVPGLGGIPFELWRRYYYPNIRDQIVAKAHVPLAKLCAMVTMQKHGEANVQNFSVPLKLLPGDASDGLYHRRVQDTGLIDLTVKYQPIIHKKLKDESKALGRGNNHVCMSLFITQACGLKAAALVQAQHNPSLSYAAEVGVNAYLVIQIPFGKKHEYVTRTVARTFSPEFSYQADMLLPIVVSQDHSNGKLSLAEQLEKSQISYEVWHQVCHGTSFAAGVDSRKRQDVLLGVGKVPLARLVSHRTGIKGWFAVDIPGEGPDQHETTSEIYMTNAKDIDKVVGGLELSINFSEAESRDHVIHISRGMGWAPALGLDYQGTTLDNDDLSTDAKRMDFLLKIDKAWIPSSELRAFNAKETKVNEKTVLYARYKFYNKAPICTKPSPMREVKKDTLLCELKHSQSLNVIASASFTWYMTEECLEIQLWLSRKQQRKAKNNIHTDKRDRLVGSGYVNLSDLHICQTDEQNQMSGLFPLFRTGASDLYGACVRVEASLKWVSLDDSNGLHKANSTEEELSSESLGTVPVTENKDLQHGAMISSHEQEQANKPKQYATEGEPISNEGNDTFAAHILIEQALHLPVISESKGAWSLPNVYVSYQTGPSVVPSSTKTVLASTSPTWEYQKLEKMSYKSLQTQGIVFKVWHKPQRKEKGLHTSDSNYMDKVVCSSAGDHVIGFVSFDLAPLAVGMRMLIGWYNITDFNGQCKGQIKLGIAPVTALSPPRPLPLSRTAYLPSSGNQETLQEMFVDKSGEAHCQTNSGSIWNHKSVEDQMEDLPSSQQQILSLRDKSTEVTFAHLPDCSSSGLFSQLRQNMMELDALQQDLNTKLTRCDCKKGGINQGVPRVHHGKTGSHLNRGDRSASNDEVMNNPSIQSTVTVFEGNTQYPESSQVDGDVCANEALTGAAHTVSHPCHSGTEEDKGTYSLSSNNKSPTSTSILNTLDIPSDIQSYSTCVHFESEPMKDIGNDIAEPLNGRQSSVESDASTSPVSGPPSVTDDIKENVDTRFADLQDSWLSDQECESLLGNSGPCDGHKLSGFSFQTGGNVEVIREDISFDSTLLSTCIETELAPEKDEKEGKDAFVVKVQRNASSVGNVAKVHSEMYEKKSDHNSDCSDMTLAEEPSKETQLPILHSGRMVNATLQNFFMPTEKIAESMRALRLGQSSHIDNNFESRLLTKASKSEVQQTSGTKKILFPESTKRKTVFKARRDTRPPISSTEADRIAKIFNSSN